MNSSTPTAEGPLRSLLTRFVAMVVRMARPRNWRHKARASEVLDAVLATASDSVFFVDARGKVRDCNLVAEQMFGRDRSEVIGRGIALYLPSLAFTALRRRAKGMGHDSLSLEMPGRLETLATDSSGSTFPVSVAVRSLTVWGNRGCIVRIRDDSRREADRQQLRRLADQLAIAKRALECQNASLESRINDNNETGNEAKTAFQANRLQEYRTSIQEILRHSRLGQDCLQTSPDAMLRNCFETIERCGTELLESLTVELGVGSSTGDAESLTPSS